MSDLRTRVRRRAAAKFLIMAALAALFESLALYVAGSDLLVPTVKWPAAALLHICAAASFLLFRKRPRGLAGLGHYLPKLCGILTLFLPLAGLVGSVLSVMAAHILLESKGLATHMEGHEYRGDTLLERIETQDSAQILREEISIQPIIDIMSGEDMNLKRGAINLLRRMGTAEAVGMLKNSLTDPAPEVRFYAHTALARLEEKRIDALQEAERKAASEKPEDLRILAMAYRDYADSGLPEQTMREHYWAQAYEIGTRVLFSKPDDIELTLMLGDLAYERGEPLVAEGFYANMLNLGKGMMEAYLGLCRIKFEQGDMLGLRHLVQSMRETDPQPSENPAARTAYAFWASSGEAS